MKKFALSLLIVPSLASAAISLEIEATYQEETHKESIVLTNEPQTVNVEGHTVVLYATEQPDEALIKVEVFKDGDTQPVCTPIIKAPWNEPLTFACPKEDEPAIVTITATQIPS